MQGTMENCLELEQAYNALQVTFEDMLQYNQYLAARCDMLERKVETVRGEWVLAIAKFNMLKHEKALKRLAEE